MHFGVVFPQTEFGKNPGEIRQFAQTVERLGYQYLLVYDHVLGANPDRPGGWDGVYTYKDAFHEVFVLLGYLAAVTTHLQLVTGVVILPQRQTALVAKQAAEVDILSGGRLTLGVGVGWNPVEYIALDRDFDSRGQVIEEQIEVLRLLWQNELVTFQGRYHHIPDAGLNPLPLQRPIPIWMAGDADVALRRIARLADGWIPHPRFFKLDATGKSKVERLRGYLNKEGRELSDIAIAGLLDLAKCKPSQWVDLVQTWQSIGATHLAIITMKMGHKSPSEHLQIITEFMNTLTKSGLTS